MWVPAAAVVVVVLLLPPVLPAGWSRSGLVVLLLRV
jgi:hypothetical protein